LSERRTTEQVLRGSLKEGMRKVALELSIGLSPLWDRTLIEVAEAIEIL